MYALLNGPWQILGHTLSVQLWTPQFRATVGGITRAVVWVQFPDLDPSRYHPRILSALGRLVGRPLKTDVKTENIERGQYARVTVEVDLSQPLKGKVELDREELRVSYEGLPQVYFSCGCFGHQTVACPQRQSKPSAPAATASAQPTSTTTNPATPASSTGTESSPAFGEWMVVPKRTPRWNRKESGPVTHPRSSPQLQGSRFHNLAVDEGDGQPEILNGATLNGKAPASYAPLHIKTQPATGFKSSFNTPHPHGKGPAGQTQKHMDPSKLPPQA
ncbi:hypothetical protein Tsubulata_042261 [Turnera subulata]|uniref:DUF4283 domain-containing protein n=1 Tax=Turnera subulata TaxID=218843 RepID=A0A9Q0JLW1_9ROSI|nr:hypothetical protein Tsubulata_042261 [Turnera subulata]